MKKLATFILLLTFCLASGCYKEPQQVQIPDPAVVNIPLTIGYTTVADVHKVLTPQMFNGYSGMYFFSQQNTIVNFYITEANGVQHVITRDLRVMKPTSLTLNFYNGVLQSYALM